VRQTSAYAEIVVKNKEDTAAYRTLYQRLIYAENFFGKKMERINSLSTRVFSPEREIGRYLQRLDEIETRLNHSMQRILRNQKHHIEKLIMDVNSFNPQNRITIFRHKMDAYMNSMFNNISHIITLKKGISWCYCKARQPQPLPSCHAATHYL
jgi:exonuclease VII large subunit